MKKIIIAGGSGFLGQVLKKHLTDKHYIVKTLTRIPKNENDVFWNAKDLGNWTEELNKSYALINLTGKSVDCRYTEANKREIYNSRINTTHLLGLAVNLCEIPPKVWINSSTATIYEDSYDKLQTEYDGNIGDDFSMNIAKSWEESFYKIDNPNTRKIAIRTSIVMGKNGGALKPLKAITKLGLGGKQGTGKQKVSWIHELDFARAVKFLLDNEELEGNFNLSVENPIDNETLMKSLRKNLNIPFGLSQPIWLIQLGAKMIGTEPELVLKSRNVIPKRLIDNGFKFKFTKIDDAITDLFE